MASIKQRGNTYQIAVFLGRDENQKKLFKYTEYTPSAKSPKAIEKEVQAFAHDFEQRVMNGEIYAGDDTTFWQFVQIWKENFLPQKTQKIQEEYYSMVTRYFKPTLGHMKLTKIRATHIDAVLKDLTKAGRAPKTVRYAFTVINSVMRYAFKKQYIKENPCLRCDDLPTVTKDRKIHCFDVDQVNTFMNALTLEYVFERDPSKRILKNGTVCDVSRYDMKHSIPFQFQAYFAIAIYCGCRRGEIVALTWEDIDFENQCINVSKSISKVRNAEIVKTPKTNAGYRTIPMIPKCSELLRAWKTEQMQLCLQLGSAWKGFRGEDFNKNYVFIDRTNGTRMSVDCPSHKFHEVVDLYNEQYAKTEEDKLPIIRLHDLRHTFATVSIVNGVDVATVAKIMGHSKISHTLDIYTETLRGRDRQAAQLLERAFS